MFVILMLLVGRYYDKTKFFRVVPDFIVQGGDPTNSGQGGESIWSKPFKDEIHSRLRFVRRGLLAMANSGKDDNGSQFFFTLAPTRELQNKHTIFGKVVGDTIFNMLRLSDCHLEDGDRPKYPHKIIRTRVLINPFTDIVPRETIQQEVVKKKSRPESKMKGTKDFKLLSFGEEAEDDEESLNVGGSKSGGRGKSAHDLGADPSLLARAGGEDSEGENSEEEAERKRQELSSVKDRLLKRKAEKEMMDIRTKLKKTDVVAEFLKEEKQSNKDKGDDDLDFEYECPIEKEKQRRREEVQKEFKALAKELKPKKTKEKKEDQDTESERMTEEERNNDLLLSYHTEQKKYKEKTKGNVPKKKASREDATLAMLAKFKQKLTKMNDEDDGEDEKRGGEGEVESDEDVAGDSWMKNTLRFESNDPVLAKDASTKVRYISVIVGMFLIELLFFTG